MDLLNSLSSHAYSQGSDYFYQIGDDITFHREEVESPTSWATAFVEHLTAQGNLGLIAPSDIRHQCRSTAPTTTATTAKAVVVGAVTFVSRKHIKLFGGLHVPLGLRDRYSDTWLTKIYQLTGLRQCLSNFTIINGVNGRYSCSIMSRYHAEVTKGVGIIRTHRGY